MDPNRKRKRGQGPTGALTTSKRTRQCGDDNDNASVEDSPNVESNEESPPIPDDKVEVSIDVDNNGEGVVGKKLMGNFNDQMQAENEVDLESNRMINNRPMMMMMAMMTSPPTPQPVEGLQTQGNIPDSLNLNYWKSKAMTLEKKTRDLEVEMAIQKLKLEKKARDLEMELMLQKLESDKKTLDLKADLAYWKDKAEELERNHHRGDQEQSESTVGLRDLELDVANCRVTNAKSTSTAGSAVKSDFVSASLKPSTEESSDEKGRNKGNKNVGGATDDPRKLEEGEIASESEYLYRSVDLTEEEESSCSQSSSSACSSSSRTSF